MEEAEFELQRLRRRNNWLCVIAVILFATQCIPPRDVVTTAWNTVGYLTDSRSRLCTTSPPQTLNTAKVTTPTRRRGYVGEDSTSTVFVTRTQIHPAASELPVLIEEYAKMLISPANNPEKWRLGCLRGVGIEVDTASAENLTRPLWDGNLYWSLWKAYMVLVQTDIPILLGRSPTLLSDKVWAEVVPNSGFVLDLTETLSALNTAIANMSSLLELPQQKLPLDCSHYLFVALVLSTDDILSLLDWLAKKESWVAPGSSMSHLDIAAHEAYDQDYNYKNDGDDFDTGFNEQILAASIKSGQEGCRWWWWWWRWRRTSKFSVDEHQGSGKRPAPSQKDLLIAKGLLSFLTSSWHISSSRQPQDVSGQAGSIIKDIDNSAFRMSFTEAFQEPLEKIVSLHTGIIEPIIRGVLVGFQAAISVQDSACRHGLWLRPILGWFCYEEEKKRQHLSNVRARFHNATRLVNYVHAMASWAALLLADLDAVEMKRARVALQLQADIKKGLVVEHIRALKDLSNGDTSLSPARLYGDDGIGKRAASSDMESHHAMVEIATILYRFPPASQLAREIRIAITRMRQLQEYIVQSELTEWRF